MDTLYEKACKGMYFEKYDKNDNLMRTAEQFNSSYWVVSTFKGKDLSGEYDELTFNKEIKKYFN